MKKAIIRNLINIIKNAFSFFNILIEKRTPLNTDKILLKTLLVNNNISTVIDVGANKGQFVNGLLEMGYMKNILSFEPLPDIYSILEKNASNHPYWETVNMAVGDSTTKISINVSANTESSSVLPMLSKHKDLAPQSNYINTIEVNMTTLDDYLCYKNISDNIYLKIDVQGFEESVLAGATKTLDKVRILQLEVSFIPLYENKTKYYELIKEIEDSGFFFYSFLPAFVNNATGQMYQMDAIFCKSS